MFCRIIFFYTKIPDQIHLQLVWGDRVIFIDIIVMSSSFLWLFMIVNHKLILGSSMSFFLLALIAYLLSSSLSPGIGICCGSVQSIKTINPGKYDSTSSVVVFSASLLFYIFFEVRVHIALQNFLTFVCSCKRYSDLNQIESQLAWSYIKTMLCCITMKFVFLWLNCE